MATLRVFIMGVTLLLWAGFACGQTWTQTSAPTNNWRGIALSADGMRIIALNCIEAQIPAASTNPIYISTDSGVDWGPASAAQWYEWDGYLGYDGGFSVAWTVLTCSADGNKLFVTSPFGLWISTNLATTWSNGGPVNWDGYVGLGSICSSSDGNKVFGVAGAVYASFDSGVTWTNPPSPADLTFIATSADGTKLVAGTIYYNGLYVSTNSGANWSATGPSNLIWGAVASSANGSHLVAVVDTSSLVYSNGSYINVGGPIYVSADSGATWAQTTAPIATWQSVASSADGTKLVAAFSGGPIYNSADSGATWTPANVPSTNWQCVAMSADGNTMVATVQGGGIWVSHSTPSPQLNVTVSPINVVLSWIVPSTSFVLQQSTDLVSWEDVTNQPVLNLTNLQNQVTLSPSKSSGFFRLKTP